MSASLAGPAVVIIPARAGSTRLPLKPLAPLAGRPLIAHVVARALTAGDALTGVYVATDSGDVAAEAERAGARALRVDAPCHSGTDRVAKALRALPEPPAVVVNVQGDEPFLAPDLLPRLVAAVRAGAPVATAAAPCPADALGDRHAVKVVCDARGHALYFSRAPIPGRLHLGVYAFRADALPALAALPRGPLATAEDLEQLAWLEAGWPIAVVDAARPSLSIDTPADLARAQQIMADEDPK